MSDLDPNQKVKELFDLAHQSVWGLAIARYDSIISLCSVYHLPDNVKAKAYVWRNLLWMEVKLKSLDQIKMNFDNAIMVAPTYGLAYYGRAWVRHKRRDYEGELTDLQQGLSLEPEQDGYYYRGMGIALAGMERYHEAIEAYNRAIELNGNQDKWTLFRRGECYSAMKMYDFALTDFNHCLDLDPDWGAPINSRGETYFLMKSFDMAIRDFTLCIQRNPTSALGYLRRAETYQKLGDNKRAAADYRAVLKMRIPLDTRNQIETILRKLPRFCFF